MVICWNKKFKSVEVLWQHPDCFVKSVAALRHRLKTLLPEEAVRPRWFVFLGHRYTSISDIFSKHTFGISKDTLYQRLGLCYNGYKVTVEQATCPRIWNRLESMKRAGEFNTLIVE